MMIRRSNIEYLTDIKLTYNSTSLMIQYSGTNYLFYSFGNSRNYILLFISKIRKYKLMAAIYVASGCA